MELLAKSAVVLLHSVGVGNLILCNRVTYTQSFSELQQGKHNVKLFKDRLIGFPARPSAALGPIYALPKAW